MIANTNTLAGFNGTALSGSKVNVAMGNPSSLSNNGQQGLTMTVSGANSSSLFNVNTLAANSNGQQGLLTTVSAGGNLDFRSIASTYNNNGTGATKYDGVDMRVNGNTSTLLSLFDGGSANGNGRDGYHFGGLTDAGSLASATLTASLNNGVTSTGNGRDSLNFDAQSGAKAALLSSGTPLTLTGPANLNFSSVAQTAVANLTGNFQFNNNAAGSGLTAKFSSANTAIFNLNGLGASHANGNSGSGLDISMSGVTNGSVQVAGFGTANNNLADGIKVLMNNVTTGALSLQGVNAKTLLNGNAGDGLDTQLTNVSLINNFGSTVAAPTITQLTTSSNQPSPYAVLPLPVTGPVSLAGVTPATAFNVNNFSANANSLGGVIVDATRLTIANGGSMSNNVGNGSNGGDGIRLKINDSALVGATANNFLFNNNSASVNKGDGLPGRSGESGPSWVPWAPRRLLPARACPIPSRSTTPALAAPSAFAPALSMCSRWCPGTAARPARSLRRPAPKIVWAASAVKPPAPPTSCRSACISATRPPAPWVWPTEPARAICKLVWLAGC